MRMEGLPKQSLKTRMAENQSLFDGMDATEVNLGCKVRLFANKFPPENKCNIYACEVQSKFPPVSFHRHTYMFHCWKSSPILDE